MGLGGNLGSPGRTFARALPRLVALGARLPSSPVYRSRALGPPQPDYLNAAVLLECELEPLALLSALRQVEQDLGRERRERWGPRTLDLDILWIEGELHVSPSLTVPHPGLLSRDFALRPLLDLVPDARPPGGGPAYALALERLGVSPLEPVAPRISQEFL